MAVGVSPLTVAMLALCVALAPSVAGAQQPEPDAGTEPDGTESDEETAERARALFDEALAAIGAGRYDEAVESLRRSLELEPRSATAFNLAVALRGTGDLLAAEEVFRGLLEGRYGELDESRTSQVTALLTEVREQIGLLRIRVSGADDPVLTVDGEPAEIGAGGTAEVRVNPGERNVLATAPERRPVRRTVEVVRGSEVDVELALEVLLDERPGVLVVESGVAGAVVEIAGHGSETGRIERELPSGEYTVRVTGDDGTRTTTVDVPAGRRVRLALDPPETGLFEQPWVWVAAGVLVAGGIGVGIYLLATREGDPYVDPVWGVTEALSW